MTDTYAAIAADLRTELTLGPSSMPLHAILGRLEELAGVTPDPQPAGPPSAPSEPVLPDTPAEAKAPAKAPRKAPAKKDEDAE